MVIEFIKLFCFNVESLITDNVLYCVDLYEATSVAMHRCVGYVINPLSAGDAFKRIHTVFPQLKFDRN